MGAITNQEQHNKDVAELQAMSETMPTIKRYCCHHFGNSLASLICDAEMIEQDILSGKISEATKNSIHRVRMAIEHLMDDLSQVGFMNRPR